MNKRSLVLSLAAGLAGGLISTYVSPQLAHAQSEAPSEIRAQSFTLVNQNGVSFGTFSFDAQGRPRILLRDEAGHEIWSVVGDHNSWHNSRLDRK
jgi:hypothetical protein